MNFSNTKLPYVGRHSAIDLFSGCGGMTVGLKAAGFRVVGAVKIDPLAIETYALNHPEVQQWPGDIRKLNASDVRRALGLAKGELGLVAGCPPCQGFSSLRTLNGSRAIVDDRNDLLFDFFRFVAEFLPEHVLMANVPALAHSPLFRAFREGLLALGYDGVYDTLDAADFGVPQRRTRLLLLAGRLHKPSFARKSRTRATVKKAIGKLPPAGKAHDPIHDFPEHRSERIQNFIAKIPKNGGSRNALPKGEQLACHQRTTGFKDIYGRMRWEDVAPTLTTGCFNPSKGRFLHPDYDRAITMREAALLQTFPRSYQFSTKSGKSGVASMIGNALPPKFIAVHARKLLK